MALLGAWVSFQIEHRLIQNIGLTAAFDTVRVIEPMLQPLAQSSITSDIPSGVLESSIGSRLDTAMTSGQPGNSMAFIKIAALEGTVFYSRSQTGRTEPAGQSLGEIHGFKMAQAGQFDITLNDPGPRSTGAGLLTVMAPVRDHATGRVIAIAQMYRPDAALRTAIAATRWQTFLAFGGSTLGLLGLLYGVARAAKPLASGGTAPQSQTSDLDRLRAGNDELHARLSATAQSSERLLRRVGADLHDGPAQLLGLALLYFDSLKPRQATPAADEKFETVRGLVQDSLSEIRTLSADIAPHLERLSPADVIRLAIQRHDARSRVAVGVTFDRVTGDLPLDTKTCLYRFVQEGLRNAFQHANGAPVQVAATGTPAQLTVDIADHGPGFQCDAGGLAGGLGLAGGRGLAGLRDRIEACDGRLTIQSNPGDGTRLRAHFPLTCNRGMA